MMVEFDPLSPAFKADPYPVYDALRAAAPLFHWQPRNIWFATDHATCVALLTSDNLGHETDRAMPHETGGRPRPSERPSPLLAMRSQMFLLRDPPAHTRLRGLVQGAFSPRMVERMRPRIQAAIDHLVDAVERRGEMDVIEDLAAPLPVMVIADMLGVPEGDRHLVRRWSREIVETLELSDAPEVLERGNGATVEFTAYLRDLARERRDRPGEDLMSALVHAEDRGDALSEEELTSTCILLLVAGHETSTNLIGNGVLALLRHPDQLERWRARPDLGRSAIEEILRYDSPVQTTYRAVLRDMEFGGRRLRRGASVAFMLGSANRDPAVFEHPHRLDITRDPNPHLSFSYGIHYCLGAPLARLEGQIAIQTLLRRAPGLRLLGDTPVFHDSWASRGLVALPVRLG